MLRRYVAVLQEDLGEISERLLGIVDGKYPSRAYDIILLKRY